MNSMVNWSIAGSIIGQLPKQGGGQLPPFKGALTARHPPLRKSSCSYGEVMPSNAVFTITAPA